MDLSFSEFPWRSHRCVLLLVASKATLEKATRSPAGPAVVETTEKKPHGRK